MWGCLAAFLGFFLSSRWFIKDHGRLADQEGAQILSSFAPNLSITGDAGVVLQPGQAWGIPAAWGTLCLCSRQLGKGWRRFHCHLGLSTLPKLMSPGRNGIPHGKKGSLLQGSFLLLPQPLETSQIPQKNWNAVLAFCWGLFRVKLFYLKLPPALWGCLKLSLLSSVCAGRDLLAFTAGVGHSLNIHSQSRRWILDCFWLNF